MSTQKKSRHIGQKIWFTTAIVLSSLLLLLSVFGIFGTWYAQQALARFSVTLLRAVDDTSGAVRVLSERVDTRVDQLTVITSAVAGISGQIEDNVEDKGLVLTLLPAEQETRLVSQASSIVDTIQNIRDTVRGGIELYKSINNLPLVSLPMPDQERVENLQKTATEIQVAVEEMRQTVSDFRQGVSGQIGKVTTLAETITEKMTQLSKDLALLDQNLANLQEKARELQVTIPNLLALGAFIISLVMAYVIYTQVEMIMLYVRRWQSLGEGVVVEEAVTPIEPSNPEAPTTEG